MTRNELTNNLDYIFKNIALNSSQFKILDVGTNDTCWYYGRNEEGQHTIGFYSTVSFPTLPRLNTKSIHLVPMHGQSQKDHYLYFVLQNNRDIGLFLELMADIIINSLEYDSEKKRGIAIIERFKSWKELMQHEQDQLYVTQGIFGEMITIRDLLKNHTASDVINGWEGPELAKHDFILPGGWIETKTTLTNKETVRISSLDQLEGPNDGILYVVKVNNMQSETEGLSLKDLYNLVLSDLDNHPQEKNTFINKVIEFKYKNFMLRESIRFEVTGKFAYDVPMNDNAFPRLRSSYGRTGIKNVTYSIDLGTLNDWNRGNL